MGTCGKAPGLESLIPTINATFCPPSPRSGHNHDLMLSVYSSKGEMSLALFKLAIILSLSVIFLLAGFSYNQG